jgi:hypothetical protein
MPGDPRECRMQACECFNLAEQSTSARLRDEFTDLGKVWLRLAAEIESDGRLLEAWGEACDDVLAGLTVAEAAPNSA